MIPQITELNFPSYATISTATVNFNDMGDKTISAQIEIDGSIRPNFSYDWEVEFKGERYIHPIRIPQALKDDTSICSKIDLVFQHKTIYELKRYYFVELASTQAGTPIADKYIAMLGLSLKDFIIAFQNVLDFYFQGDIEIDLNPQYETTDERAFMNISYSYIWDVLQQIYEVYGVRWDIVGNKIRVGYDKDNLTNVFSYGYETGLLSIERQVQSQDIRNLLLGRGGSTNLPTYYFKNAPEGSVYASDPDAIPELANIPFTELRGKTFRDYVKGWKAAHYNGQPMAEPTEAYTKGYTDGKFNPIEYVKDDVSIAKYGELLGGLDNNNEIYPSIQNYVDDKIGLINEVVEVEQVLTDAIDNGDSDSSTQIISPNEPETLVGSVWINNVSTLRLNYNFTIKNGYKGTILLDEPPIVTPTYFVLEGTGREVPKNNVNIVRGWSLANKSTGDIISWAEAENTDPSLEKKPWNTDALLNLPSASYTFTIITNIYYHTNAFFGDNSPYGWRIVITQPLQDITVLQSRFSDDATEFWKPTFNIWIKNIWGTERYPEETEKEYAERVWLPILGTDGQEGMVVFSSGWLSQSSDWDFKIIKGGFAYDNTKSYNGVPSHWRLTLQKTDAELEATGLYIPNANTNANAIAGDTFFFTGIEMQQQYVEWAEERLDIDKESKLSKVSEIQPAWVVKLDKVRVNTLMEGETIPIIDELQIGANLYLQDHRFIGGNMDMIELNIQSITYTYGAEIIPDVELVLSNDVVVTKTTIQTIQGEITSLSNRIVNATQIANIVRKIGDSLYLRKDGMADVSNSETTFRKSIQSEDFREGGFGGAGWSIYRDKNGNTVAEVDRLFVRQDLNINEIVANQTSYIGGKEIISAAAIECTAVVKDEDNDFYRCYFDTKLGSNVNRFKVGDIAYSEDFTFIQPLPEVIEFETPIDIENMGEITISIDGVGFRIYDILVQGPISAGDSLRFSTVDSTLEHPEQGPLQCLVENVDAANADYEYTSPEKPYSVIKFYKRLVEAVGDNWIDLSNSEVNGSGIPAAGDTIIHYGNIEDENRQYVIIRDVIGGGYDRMLSDLNSVDATGTEYYFAGRMNNGTPRWFVGNKKGEYAEWKDGKLKIKGKLEVGSDVGGATVVDGGLVTAETISLGSEGTIKAGVTGGGESDDDVRFWAGVPYEQRALAPFRVLQDGSLHATKAYIEGEVHANSGTFKGTVNATDGVFYGSIAEPPKSITGSVTLSFETGFNFAGTVAENEVYYINLPTDKKHNGVRCTIINTGQTNGYFDIRTANAEAFIYTSKKENMLNVKYVYLYGVGEVRLRAIVDATGTLRWYIENHNEFGYEWSSKAFSNALPNPQIRVIDIFELNNKSMTLIQCADGNTPSIQSYSAEGVWWTIEFATSRSGHAKKYGVIAQSKWPLYNYWTKNLTDTTFQVGFDNTGIITTEGGACTVIVFEYDY